MPTIELIDDYVVAEGVTVSNEDAAVFFVGTPGVTLTNGGTITAFNDGATGLWAYGIHAPAGVEFINLATGVFSFTNVDPALYTIGIAAPGGLIVNDGLIYVWGANFTAGVTDVGTFNNSGHLHVVSQVVGYGADVGASVVNSGIIEVHSNTSMAHGIEAVGGAAVTNTGYIQSTTDGIYEFTYSLGIEIGGGVETPSLVVNSGAISADVAITSVVSTLASPPQQSRETVVNSGLILGDIGLYRGADEVSNSGHITGAVDLGLNNDVYDGRAGTLDGVVQGGNGDDVVLGGAGADRLEGGLGADAIQGGGGDDLISGGRDSDAIDGGAGFDTASYEDSVHRLLADLSLGTAESGGTDRLVGIEALIGTALADDIRGSSADERFEGRAGNDVLNGGDGADTLIGGSGDDTLTGGNGDDRIVFYAGHGADTVFGFTAGGTSDKLVLDGYASYQALQQIGSDTLVVLSATDSILLKNVSAAALTSADFEFGSAVAPTEAALVVQPMNIEVDFHIYTGEVYDFGSAAWGFFITYPEAGNASPSIFNDGVIMIGGTGIVAGVRNDRNWSFYDQSSFVNSAGASVLVDARWAVEAYGFVGGSWSADVYNHGLIKVEGGLWTSGVTSYGSDSFTFVNTGTIEVDGYSGTAAGVDLVNGGLFFNSGVIDVYGAGGSIGVYVASSDFVFVNSGDIIVQDTTKSEYDSVGLFYSSHFDDKVLFNSGTIQADYAIAQGLRFWNEAETKETVWNTGELLGRVFLGVGVDEVVNLGLITGEIALGEGDDLYDGRGGHQTAGVFGEQGADRLLGGSDDDDLYGGEGDDFLFGGAGADWLIGGAGVDTYRTQSGSGADVILDFEAGEKIQVGGYAGYQSITQVGGDTLVRFSASDTLLLVGIQAASVTASSFQFSAPALEPTQPTPTTPATPGTPTPRTGSTPFSVIFGATGADVVVGGDDRDSLHGGAGADFVAGGKGDDELRGGSGADVFYYTVGYGDDLIQDFNPAEGDVLWIGGVTAVSLERFGYKLWIEFADGSRLTFAEGGSSSIVEAFRTVDLLGGASADVLQAGSGQSWVQGLDGDDTLSGGSGDDRLDGGQGADTLRGGDGADSLDGGAGDDTLEGGAGSDTADYALSNSAVSVTLSLTIAQNTGGAGRDTISGVENLRGSRFGDVLTGDANANRLDGAGGDDALNGGGGGDILAGGAGVDTVDGGTGDDTILYAQGGGHDVVTGFSAGGGDDRIEVTGFDRYWAEQVGADTRIWFDADHSILLKNVTASALTGADINIARQTVMIGDGSDEVLAGTSGLDWIRGAEGEDSLSGSGGSDILEGGDGSDELRGGGGDDRLMGGAGYDFADYTDASAAVNVALWVLSSQNTGGSGKDQLFDIEGLAGSSYGDKLAGNDGDNRIDGHGGDDRLEGRRGHDTLVGGAGRDTYVYGLNDGRDAILDFSVAEDRILVDGYVSYSLLVDGPDLKIVFDDLNWIVLKNVSLAQFTDANISIPRYLLKLGTEQSEWLEGQVGGDNLRGLGGDDTLVGFGGDDLLEGGDGDDVLMGGPGTDVLIGGAGVDEANYLDLFGGVVADLTSGVLMAGGRVDTLFGIENVRGSSGFQNDLTGDGAANVLTGGAVADVLRGGAGDDLLNGGDGDDLLLGGAGNDQLNGGQGALDIADYSDATAGVTVSPDLGGAQDTIGAGVDTFWLVDGVRGSTFGDYLFGSSTGAVWLDGGAGDDLIQGGGGADILTGGSGSDHFRYAWGGHDTILDFTFGADGDRLSFEGATGYYVEVVGVDLRLVFNEYASVTLKGVSLAQFDASNISIPQLRLLTGTAAADNLVGTFEAEWIRGQDGDDVLNGAEGSDILYGEGGNDHLVGGGGNDTLNGGVGDADVIDYSAAVAGVQVNLGQAGPQDTGGAGKDTISYVEAVIGSAFNDVLTTQSGRTGTLWGGAGDDTLESVGTDRLYGEAGNDLFKGLLRYVDGGAGVDTLQWAAQWAALQIDLTKEVQADGSTFISIENVQLGAGADTVIGNDANNSLHGGAGDDRLTGGGGDDVLNGGEGLDIADFSGAIAGLSLDLALGGPQAAAGLGSDTLISIEGLVGSSFDDQLAGTSTDDRLAGGGGNDRLDGRDGSDTADYGAAASDVTVTLGLAGQQNTGGAGLDTLVSIENLRGSAFNDVLTGDAGANVISGGAGADRLRGGGGDDRLDVGDGDDTVVFAAGDGHDTVVGFTAGGTQDRLEITGYAECTAIQEGQNIRIFLDANNSILLLNVNAASLTSADFNIPLLGFQLNGTSQNEELAGTALKDFVQGYGGDDLLSGLDGDDSLFGGEGNDRLEGGMGADVLDGGLGFDTAQYWASAAGVTVNLSLTGAQNTGGAGVDTLVGIENLSGSFLADTLTGNAGDNILYGSFGADILRGGLGFDTLNGGNDADVFHFAAGDGHDHLSGFDAGAGGDRLEITGYSTFLSLQTADGLRIFFDASNSLLIADRYLGQFTAANLSLTATATIYGTVAAETLNGTANADSIDGHDGADVLNGGAGDDILNGNSGSDTLNGGSGSDTAHYSFGGAIVSLSIAGAQDTGIAGVDTLTSIENLIGSNLVDTFTGSATANRLEGDAGNDVLSGLDGDDVLFGGTGNDRLLGGAGNDRLDGGLDGGDMADYTGAASGVTVNLSIAGAQNTGGGGIDTLAGIEQVHGSSFADLLTGNAGDNALFGGDGDDVLAGGLGGDGLYGGAGGDVFRFTKGDGFDLIDDFVPGVDRIDVTGFDSYTLYQQGSDVLIVFDDANRLTLHNLQVSAFLPSDINIALPPNFMVGTDSAETLTGTVGADDISGLGGNDTLRGAEANDLLHGGDGDDTLRGDAGDDLLDGGAGNDTADYRTATAAITVSLAVAAAQNTGGAGTDTLAGIEYVQGGSANDTITGNDANNTLWGNAGADTLNGGLGNDTLIGGAGADVINGGGGLDYASYSTAAAGVTLNFATGAHLGDGAGDTFSGIERYRLSNHADTFTGGAATDQVYGFTGNDTLNGGGGIDKLYGQADADTLNGDDGNDILLGGAGGDAINGGAGRDTASYEDAAAAVSLNLATGLHTGDAAGDTFSSIEIFWLSNLNDSFTGGTANDEVRGAGGVDTLNGGDGADRLRGEAGNDVLNGEGGDDFLWGDAGTDTFNGGVGTDTVTYTYSKSAVSLNLTTGVHTGDATGDTFTSVERFQLTDQSTQADSFTGSGGDDWVAGYKGVDTLNGMGGNDTLNGGGQNDVLSGGDGNDKLLGELGNDTLTGGAGSDQFWFNMAGFGSDTVTDFANGTDKIRITGIAGVDDFSDLSVSTNGSGWAVITLPDGSTITLTGVTAGQVDASDFSWT